MSLIIKTSNSDCVIQIDFHDKVGLGAFFNLSSEYDFKLCNFDSGETCLVCGQKKPPFALFDNLCNTFNYQIPSPKELILNNPIILTGDAFQSILRGWIPLLTFVVGESTGGCKCNTLRKMMNNGGPQWCNDNFDKLARLIDKSAAKKIKRIPFQHQIIRLVLRHAIWKSPAQ